MNNIIYAVLSLSLMGLVFGICLGYASKVFYVEVDERVEKILENLPGANCGGCGYAGCSAMADAIVKGEAKVDGCPSNTAENSANIAKIMGVEATAHEPMRAFVMCGGAKGVAKTKYTYSGAQDCLSVMRLGGGDKACAFGCIGLGSCVKKCSFDAIKIVNGVAVVDPEKCTGCGVCVNECPKKVITLIPKKATVMVKCASKDKGIDAKNACDASCIACKICEKNCPAGAITVENNVAKIDYSKCTNCGTCVEKCPRKCIILK